MPDANPARHALPSGGNRLSKLQRRILELALEAYERPPILCTGEPYAGQERYDSRNVLLADAVRAIYGVDCWRRTPRKSGCYGSDGCRCEECMERAPVVRRAYNAAWTALLRSCATLEQRELVELRGFLCHAGVRLRLTDRGVTVTRELLSKVSRGQSLNSQRATVTRCPCGAALDAQRSTRRYCSAACRQTAYRMRQEPSHAR